MTIGSHVSVIFQVLKYVDGFCVLVVTPGGGAEAVSEGARRCRVQGEGPGEKGPGSGGRG